MPVRCYAHGAREEQKHGFNQDNGPTVVPTMDSGEQYNCGLFVFPWVVWLRIIKLLYICPSLNSRTKE